MSTTDSHIDRSFLGDRRALKRMAALTLAFALVGVGYALLAAKWYRTTLTVVPSKSQQGGGALASLLGGDAGALASGFLEGAAGGADTHRIAAVLQSVAVSDAVIKRFDLKARYSRDSQEAAREALWTHCEVRVLMKPALVQISCEDKEPAFAQQMLAFFAEHGNKVFRRVSAGSATEEVKFLEEHVADLRRQADEASVRMRDFQEKYRIIDIDTQAKAVVSSLAALNSQKIVKQLELDYARTFSASEEQSVRQLESQLSVMERKARRLEEAGAGAAKEPGSGGHAASPAGGMFPPALEVPKLRAEFERLYRDRRVAEATLVFALERLEGARASAARDVSTFMVLDPPALPTRKHRPKRLLIVEVATLLGLAVSVGIEWWRMAGRRVTAVIGVVADGTASRDGARLPEPRRG